MMNPIKITIYRWAGQKWGFRIKSECLECDLSVGQVRSLRSAHPEWPLEIEVKSWLDNLWESLRAGGWHAPVVLVDGRLVSQGRVPTATELESALCQAFARGGVLFGVARPGDCRSPFPNQE